MNRPRHGRMTTTLCSGSAAAHDADRAYAEGEATDEHSVSEPVLSERERLRRHPGVERLSMQRYGCGARLLDDGTLFALGAEVSR